jgi:hypothetical protein
MSMLCKNKLLFGVFWGIFFVAPMMSMAQVAWVKDFDAALKQAATEKKFLVLDMSASW